MNETYELNKLDEHSFEHLANLLAMRVLGYGHTGFGPGPDGGRDGFFEGEAPYPSESEHWTGRWYLQSKFHRPHLSKDPQKWLLGQIKEELKAFQDPDSKRVWPDNWIIVTNIDPSGSAETGLFDSARALVKDARSELSKHFHIWGGGKVLGLLALHHEIAEHYAHFLTPGEVLTTIYAQLKDSQAEIKSIVRYLVVKQFEEQQHTKLEQAGSTADTRPGIHRLFTDLPFEAHEYGLRAMVTEYLTRTAAKNHRLDPSLPDTPEWRMWRRHPSRAGVWFIRGGPGQGKSTVTQYFCQIQRALLILENGAPVVAYQQKTLASEVRDAAEKMGFLPLVPRIPVSVELKDFAQWFGQKKQNQSKGILTYLSEHITANVEQVVHTGTLKRAFSTRSWLLVFDGLDEVPSDVKDAVASEVRQFIDNVLVECNADALTVCTSRPQGYSGQFAEIDGPTIDLITLSPQQALQCARPILAIDRTPEEASAFFRTLTSSIESTSVRQLMTTPLQAHIMAVVVRDGGRPPERRWQLFTNFYQVIKKREANRNLPDARLAKLLREGDRLLKNLHNRLGFVLHSSAETSEGAQTSLKREQFRTLVTQTVSQLIEQDVDETIELVMEATTDRLVLVNTPEHGGEVRFDIRPLQEFFAAEYLYEAVGADVVRRRLEILSGDSHWREVMHFLLSALVENSRQTELSVAVGVLQQLNLGPGDSQERLVSRRIGRGAVLAARLLQEGVLEQDKRIRQQFRECIQPMLASTDWRALAPLVSVRNPNSRGWLFNLLIDGLKESDPTECIGAALVLSAALPDDHERVNEVKERILSFPPRFRSLLFEGRPRQQAAEVGNAFGAQWPIEVGLKSLLREDWASFAERPVVLRILGSDENKERVKPSAQKCGLSPAICAFLPTLFSDPAIALNESDSLEDYGLIQCRSSSRSDPLGFNTISGELRNDLANSSGFLHFIYRILKFTTTRSRSDLLDLYKYIRPNLGVLLNLPTQISAYLPIQVWFDDIDKEIEDVEKLTDQEFASFLANRQSHGTTKHLVLRRIDNPTLSDWTKTLERFPSIALQFWNPRCWPLYQRGNPRPEFLDEDIALDALIYRCSSNPRMLISNPESWGRLLKLRPNRDSELRDAFMKASSGAPSKLGLAGDIAPFRIILPSEASLLPHIAKLLFDANYVDYESHLPIARVKELLKGFIDDPSALKSLIGRNDISSGAKAAAVLMYLLHPDSLPSARVEFTKSLAGLYSENLGKWHLVGIGLYLRTLWLENEPLASRAMGQILDLVRADYQGRRALDAVLDVWRQTSRAPVQNNKAADVF